jgi:hypothetical protein
MGKGHLVVVVSERKKRGKRRKLPALQSRDWSCRGARTLTGTLRRRNDLARLGDKIVERRRGKVACRFGISRRSVGRTVDVEVEAVLCDEEAVTVARTCLADTESRGSTLEERAAAATWLDEQTQHSEHPELSLGRRHRVRLRGSGRAKTVTPRGTRAPWRCLPRLHSMHQVQAGAWRSTRCRR